MGEGIALRELLLKGFAIQKWNSPEELPESVDIEAIEPITSKLQLIRVRSAVAPNIPEGLSSDLEGEMKIRAKNAGAEAWEAKVQLDSNLRQGTVSWRRLE